MKAALIKRGGKPPALKGRPLTALPNWPLTLLTGVEGSGKSYTALEAATSPLIGHCYALELGEGSLDAYGAIPGVLPRVTWLEHDGTYADITGQLWAASEAPRVDGKPNLIIVDSMTSMWDLLVNEQQEIADRRARRNGKRVADGEAEIHSDLWNAAKKRWLAITDLLKEHDGPSIITARLNEVAIFEGNAPRRDGAKEWKVEAHKSTPSEADVVLQARAPRSDPDHRWICTKVRSLKLTLEAGKTADVPDLTMDKFWRMMGLDETTVTARRQVTALNASAGADQQEAEEAALAAQGGQGGQVGQVVAAAQRSQQPQRPRRGTERPAERPAGRTIEQWRKDVAEAPSREKLTELHAAAQQANQLTQGLLAAMQARAAELDRLAAEAAPALAAVAAAHEATAPAEEDGITEDERRGMLIEEITNIAETTGMTVDELIARHLPDVGLAAPIDELQEAVASFRPLAIAKLIEAGRVEEATAYVKVKPDECDTWANLLTDPAAAAA